jgi:hypothetical protein
MYSMKLGGILLIYKSPRMCEMHAQGLECHLIVFRPVGSNFRVNLVRNHLFKKYVPPRDRTPDLLNMAEPNREHAKKKMSQSHSF